MSKAKGDNLPGKEIPAYRTPELQSGKPIREGDPKTDGIKQRGSGAATKGFTSRGPLA